MGLFLRERLYLTLHPNKIQIRKMTRGIDFLGYVVLPHRTVVRTKTKRRMLRRVNSKNLASYLVVCGHARALQLQKQILARV